MMLKINENLFLKTLFNEFDKRGLSYAVMRNYETLPNTLDGSDLDIIILPDQKKKICEAINEAVRYSGGKILGEVHSANLFKIYAFGETLVNEESLWWGARLDVSMGFRYEGASQVLDEKALWESHIEEHKGVKVLSHTAGTIIAVLKDLLYTGKCSPKYLDSFLQINDDVEVKRLLKPVGKKATSLILSINGQAKDVNTVDCAKLRKLITTKSLKRNLFLHYKNKSTYYFSKLKRIVNPPGKSIAFMGVDGAGKTTIINAIYPVLEQATHGAIKTQHLRPHLLPPLSRVKGKEETGVVTDPHKEKPSGFFVSLIRLSYYASDYIAGYWFKTRMYLSREPRILIFDRYAYDLVIDPRRFRIKLPQFILKGVVKLMPRPDLIICLHAEPEKIFERKGEVSVVESERQIHVLKSVADKIKNANLVDTGNSIEGSSAEVLRLILNKIGS